MTDAEAAFPRVTCPPGQFIRWALDHVDMSQSEFARQSGYSAKQVNATINGHEGISPRMATRLADVLGVPSAVWMQLQYQHQRNLEMGAINFQDLLERHTTPKPKRRRKIPPTEQEGALSPS